MPDEMSWHSLREFTREGLMVALPLCFPGQSVPPPAGQTAIKGMALNPYTDTLYLGTEGEQAHLLAAMIHQDTGIVHDMGAVPEATSVDALCVLGEDVRFIASGPVGSALYATAPCIGSFYIQEWGISRRPLERVGAVLEGQPVAHAIPSQDRLAFLGVGGQSGEVFRTEIQGGRTTVLGQLDARGKYSRRLGMDRDGRIWGTYGNARLWTLDPARGEVERLPLTIPCAAGREQHTQVSAWAVDPDTGTLYGGTRPDGFLFRLNPQTREVVSLGKPCRQDLITCLAVGHDGRLFGMAGTADDIGHSFCYDPASGSLRDLGIPVSTLTQRQYGYHYACAVTGVDGEIYFGQHERVNYLWIYFPAVPKRKAAAGQVA
ncbi:MAG: hypothetical protein AB1505_23595 [Candidatus Latescibacterota bacterium]